MCKNYWIDITFVPTTCKDMEIKSKSTDKAKVLFYKFGKN